ncbi:MAG TPA: hypothetical protein VM328_05650, partial [Fimbriimonadaceae bacterium]|nr:hypothetical protein [Fimbriimonadaceae bacterium]
MRQTIAKGLVLGAIAVVVRADACDETRQTSVILRDGKVIAKTPTGERELTEDQNRGFVGDPWVPAIAAPAYSPAFSIGLEQLPPKEPIPALPPAQSPAGSDQRQAPRTQDQRAIEELSRSIAEQMTRLAELLRRNRSEGREARVQSKELEEALARLRAELGHRNLFVAPPALHDEAAARVYRTKPLDVKGLEKLHVAPKLDAKALEALKAVPAKALLDAEKIRMEAMRKSMSDEMRKDFESAMREAHEEMRKAQGERAAEMARARAELQRELMKSQGDQRKAMEEAMKALREVERVQTPRTIQ